MSFNPYEPPTSAYDGTYVNSGAAGSVVSDRVVAGLRKARPWALLVAVMLFINAGFIALGSLGIAIDGEYGTAAVALTFAAITALPGVFLARYASAISRLLHGGGVPELEQAVEAQGSFWQVTGIMTLVMIGMFALVIIAGIAAGLDWIRGF